MPGGLQQGGAGGLQQSRQIVAAACAPLAVDVRPGDSVLRLRGALTAHTASAFCQAARAQGDTAPDALTIDCGGVVALDIVGLAALRQVVNLGTFLGVRVSARTPPLVHQALLDAELLDDIEVEPIPPSTDAPAPTTDGFDTLQPYLASTARLALRRPHWSELPLFAQWAEEPLLDQMVGSELLYQCRHLGPYHPEFIRGIFADPTSLTVLVEPLAPPHAPIGFLRLYNVRLAQEFAFLETAIADLRFLRRGWGVDATRFLLAYGFDALGTRRIEAKVYAYNVLSSNSLKRGGFEQEGALRQARLYNGQRWDIYVYAILEDEMREQRKKERFPSMSLWDAPA